jgi:hypothetical protein
VLPERDGAEPDEGGEPSLASPANHHDQVVWASGDSLELEEEHDAREPDGDAEAKWQPSELNVPVALAG